MAEAQPLFNLPFPGNHSCVCGAAWKTGEFYSISAGKVPQISSSHQQFWGWPTFLDQQQKQEVPPHSTNLNKTLRAHHQTAGYTLVVAPKWRVEWDFHLCFYTLCQVLKLCRAKEEASADFGQLQVLNSHVIANSFHNSSQMSAWDDTLGSLDKNSTKAGMFWGQFKVTELWEVF